ncbi:MAG TPA: glycosyltransferase [Candidatus Hydrogenedentes bacterium]|nr:glycosyltransferase [Candidatus Hydrogenedentota bacterium]HOS02785.1 glycosyltransferase [Candidatus Hydrogenedentota bacterium]
MNVLHIDEQTGWRGGELQASWLIKALVQRGDAVALAGKRGSPFLSADYGSPAPICIDAGFHGEIDLATAWKLARAVREHAVDILHAQTSHAHMYACLARMLAGRGKVVVARRVSFEPKANPLNRWKYGMPDRFVAVSQRVADVLLEFGLPQDKVSVVHSAIDLKRLEAPPLSRGELGVPEGVPLLGSAGALVGHKDHANLIDAMPAVLRAFPNARLVIAGEGALRPAIEAQIARLGLGKAVTLLGHRADAPRIIKAVDVYVSSSWSEGLGTSVLEALASGVPTVATDAGGVGEMVIDGQTGLFAPQRNAPALADAIVRMLHDKDGAQRMAQAGRAFVRERFTVERMIAGNLRVYDELMQRV